MIVSILASQISPLYRDDSQPRIVETLSVKIGISTSPAVSQEGFVVVSSTGWQLYCFDISSGDELWDKDFSSHSHSGPLIVGDKVIYKSGHKDKKIVAYDIHTDDDVWVVEDYGGGGQLSVYDGDIITPAENFILRLDPSTGDILWKYPVMENIITEPAIIDGVGYFTTLSGNLIAIELKNGEELDRIELSSPVHSSPVSYEGLIYIAPYDGRIISFDTADKTVETIYEGSEPVYADLVHDEDRIYFITISGVVYSIDRSGNLMWSYDSGYNVDAGAVIYEDQLIYGADDGFLRSISRDDGREIWNLQLVGQIKSKPILYNNKMLVGTMRGKLYIIDLPGD